MILERLIEIHSLQDGRVEAGEKLGSNDQNFEWIFLPVKSIEQLILSIFIECPFLFKFERIVGSGGDDDGASSLAKYDIEAFFVVGTCLTIRSDDHGLESMRFDLLLKVFSDVFDDGLNSLWGFEEGRHLRI